MARKCDSCGALIRGLFTYKAPIVRQDDATGYTYRFCSEQCAAQWAQNQKQAVAACSMKLAPQPAAGNSGRSNSNGWQTADPISPPGMSRQADTPPEAGERPGDFNPMAGKGVTNFERKRT